MARNGKPHCVTRKPALQYKASLLLTCCSCNKQRVNMMDLLTFERENRERIQSVENSFGRSGKPLLKIGRMLMGEGHLLKQGRRKPRSKAFFLFTDVLVYGGIILNGRWYKNQRIIPLEDIVLEDMEDGEIQKNQWLIRTPRKSFFVSAPSKEEKQAWIKHIEDCRASRLQVCSLQPNWKPPTFALSFIPGQAAQKCMRCCSKRFSATEHRHHCRICGFVVCSSCSRQRQVLSHIHPTKQLRVCSLCNTSSREEKTTCQRGDSVDRNSSEEDELSPSSGEEDGQQEMMHVPSRWLDFTMETWKNMDSWDCPT